MDDLETRAVDTEFKSLNNSKQEKSFDRLKHINVVAWEQVLLLLPKKYEDYTVIEQFLPNNEALYPTKKACYDLTVISQPNSVSGSPPRLSFNVTDGCSKAKLTVFGDIWSWKGIGVGERIIVEAIVDIWNGELQLKNPVRLHNNAIGKVLPIYKGKKNTDKSKSISSEFVYEKTREALKFHLEDTVNYIKIHFPSLDEKFLLKRASIQFQSLGSMLTSIHSPKSAQEGEAALTAARSLAAFEVIFNAEQQMARKPNSHSVISIRQSDIDAFIDKFPHKLTEHQLNGIKDIVDDLKRPYQMNRLLSGDVGFGKTDVALIPALAARASGAKVAVMCPSKIIVDQWIEKIRGYGAKIPIQAVSGKEKINTSLLPLNPIFIGTTALVTQLPKLKIVPDFVIFDEQHKHGKNHKESLVGPATNRLEATATCQPKTAAMVNYGGMDETILNQCPVEKKIVSRIVLSSEGTRLFNHIKKVMSEMPDAQFAIVYPSVSANNKKTSLIASTSTWESNFPGQIGVIHGKMTDQEKGEIIQKMHRKEIKILLSSILIETGVTLPSLRGMVVVGADKFGVSSLHQLRGRLARKGGKGYFYMLVNDDTQAETMSRLDLLVEHTDGFVLAEKDAEMRGYGTMSDEDEGQSGVSKSSMFYGMRLMPKDIEELIQKKKQ